MMMKTPSLVLTAFIAAVGSASVTGCGGATSGTTSTPPDQIGEVKASLHRAKGCGDLLTDLKADARYKMERAINRQIYSLQSCILQYGETSCGFGGGGVDFGGRGGAEPPMANAGDSAAGSGTSGAAPKESASSYSQTNTQVKGVDEADFVKNDGKNIYIIHGRSFKVINAWPANELKEVATLDIEGSPSEMFVENGKVVIYSYVNGADVFQAAGVAPKTQYQEYYYGYGYGGGGIAADAPAAGPGGFAPSPYPSGPFVPLTKITVLKLDGTNISVSREMYFEGNYLDARRVGPHVRTVLQGYAYGPKIMHSYYELYPQPTTAGQDPYPKTAVEVIGALGRLRDANVASIEASVIEDYLPYTFVRQGGAVKAETVACSDFYVPSAGSTESGLTEVASINLDDPGATLKQTAILGRADTVYGGTDNLYLAAHGWIEPFAPWWGGGNSSTNTPALPVRTYSNARTHLHKFEFKTDATFPNYQASGTVNGSVKDQFSLDDKDGYLRIATNESRSYIDAQGRYFWPNQSVTPTGEPAPNSQAIQYPNSVNHVFVLGQQNDLLSPVGAVQNLAPNEQIYSVRFVESRGYVVTFRRTDPLFVFDLAAPQAPKLLGAVTIPGFSEYMHPLDANHLLTIGRNATDTGRTQGLQLQIFDVTNGAAPVVQTKFTYTGSEYGSSEAEYDHKAFTYFAEKKLLAFPYFSYDSTNGGARSTLELFRVDLATGFSKVGSVDSSSLAAKNPTGYCGGYYGPSVRRGIFLENFVYSISYGGVTVRDSNNLGTPVVDLPLSLPVTNNGYGPVCAY